MPFALEHDNAIWDLDVSPDGSLLATADFDGSVRVYQTGTWRLLNKIAADTFASRSGSRRLQPGVSADDLNALRTVRFNSASTMLVTSSLDRTARVWTPLLGRANIPELSYRLPPGDDKRPRRINSVALNPSREEVAFTDRAAVYVKSVGKLPKALPSGRSTERATRLSRTSTRCCSSHRT
ncbi:hypothetical protein CJI59_37275 [Streptomyces sp. Alain-F2R5]|nr:hypothetical protein CJI59_37275 [Streptomyces sp. Alain-F2R5]